MIQPYQTWTMSQILSRTSLLREQTTFHSRLSESLCYVKLEGNLRGWARICLIYPRG
jgi:hypothetical protein